MGASAFEYRFRYILHGVIYALGFWSLWLPWIGITKVTVWSLFMITAGREGWLNFNAAAVVPLCLAILCAAAGAFLRVWGTAYVGSNVVHSASMQGGSLLVDGPYRRSRNPLYLGTLLHTFGVALIMPWTGAIFTIILIWIFQIRLALAEEPYLTAEFGEPYIAYKMRVPRFVPALSPRVPAAGLAPRWGQAALGEIYMIGVFITLAGFSWSFNVNTLIQGVLISLGVSLVARAFLPKLRIS